ncbi:hypothetical protein AYO40_05295 [Planctomycetaceae bacterium SCGC AG-212-D15]|nr:hypothetical protein AYO40_05295 [Planctomycetaceae bacterium SCGC AG-212-D15]
MGPKMHRRTVALLAFSAALFSALERSLLANQQDDRGGLGLANRFGGDSAGQLRKIDSCDDEIGPQQAALFRELRSRLGHDNLVAET